jgi:osmotically inducible protein OsmC
MASFERQATITWEGTARDGHGEVRGGTGAFSLPVSFPSRVGAAEGKTSPEELIASAHASCYAMALAATLGRHNAGASRLHVSATVKAEFSESGLVIQASHLRVLADGLTGLDEAHFAEVAKEAEKRCPVSNALRGSLQIDVEAIA